MLDANKLQQAVDQAYTQFHSLNGGQNADYIPFLANVPGQLAAVAIVTCDGNVYSAGDSDYRFALESISKVCTLALALEDVGPQAVQDKIGADPTGLPFNSVIALELHGGKPLSPLVNAGAIATTSLINAENVEQRWQRILHIQQQLAGEQVALSDEVNQSEQTTNFHNRAIAWLLYSAGYLYCDAMEACDVYTRQCSTLLNTIELATLGATLAAGQRLALATLSEEGIKALTVNGEWQADEYGNQWRQASLQGALTDPALADRKPLWQYAEKLDDTYCAGCHAPIAADHYTVNAWPSIAKGMGARTSMSENELDILTRYFQYNAKDITEKQ